MDYDEQPEFQGDGDGPPCRPLPWPRGVKILIVAAVSVFVAQLVFSGSARTAEFMAWLELRPDAVFGRGAVWQLVSYAFLHGSLMHILFNMLFLYWFGGDVERAWGTRRFLIFYLCAAAFSGLCYVGWSFGLGHRIPCIGASGAVMACMMVYAVWHPNRIILLFFIIPMRIRTFVVFTVCIEMYNLWNPLSGIANMAHLGGLLFGYVVVKFGPRLNRGVAARLRRSAEAVSAEDDRRLDDLLDKVHEKGVNALSWSERRFLKRMSRRR